MNIHELLVTKPTWAVHIWCSILFTLNLVEASDAQVLNGRIFSP